MISVCKNASHYHSVCEIEKSGTIQFFEQKLQKHQQVEELE